MRFDGESLAYYNNDKVSARKTHIVSLLPLPADTPTPANTITFLRSTDLYHEQPEPTSKCSLLLLLLLFLIVIIIFISLAG